MTKVKFKRALRIARVGKPHPVLFGLHLNQRMVGPCTPFDLTFSQMGLDAFGCRGYEGEDVLAVLTNFLLPASTR